MDTPGINVATPAASAPLREGDAPFTVGKKGRGSLRNLPQQDDDDDRIKDDDIYDADPGPDDLDVNAIGRLNLFDPSSNTFAPNTPYAPNYPALKMSPSGKGAAFDIDRAADMLSNSCGGSPGGACLSHVEDALRAGGFDLRAEIPMYDDNGRATRRARDASGALQNDPRFGQVGGGHGANMESPWKYQAQKGDIVVWDGASNNKYGHIAMCVGQRADGSAIWKSDFTAKESNWTGLRDPDSVGGNFRIFRQNAQEANAAPKPDAAAEKKHASVTPPVNTAPSLHS